MPGCPPLISCLCHLFLLFSLDFEQAQSNRGKEEIWLRKWYSLSDWTPAEKLSSCRVKLVRPLYWRRSRKSLFLRYVKMNTHACLPFGQNSSLSWLHWQSWGLKGLAQRHCWIFYFSRSRWIIGFLHGGFPLLIRAFEPDDLSMPACFYIRSYQGQQWKQ